MSAQTWMLRTAAVVAGVFGVLTIRTGGSVLFGGIEARIAAGDVVPFVLWFNFLAGFAYVAGAIGLWMGRRWGAWTAIAIAGATAVVFALLGVHAALRGAFEMRTVWAMRLRTVLWSAIAALAYYAVGRTRQAPWRQVQDLAGRKTRKYWFGRKSCSRSSV